MEGGTISIARARTRGRYHIYLCPYPKVKRGAGLRAKVNREGQYL